MKISRMRPPTFKKFGHVTIWLHSLAHRGLKVDRHTTFGFSSILRPEKWRFLCWIFRRSSKTHPKVDLLKGRGFLVLFPRSVCIFRNQKVRPFNFTRFSRGFNFKDLVYINFLWKKFQIRKSKSLKMDSEAILGPKWKPRGVLESGEHVESDFDLPRTWPWPLKSADLPQPGTGLA